MVADPGRSCSDDIYSFDTVTGMFSEAVCSLSGLDGGNSEKTA